YVAIPAAEVIKIKVTSKPVSAKASMLIDIKEATTIKSNKTPDNLFNIYSLVYFLFIQPFFVMNFKPCLNKIAKSIAKIKLKPQMRLTILCLKLVSVPIKDVIQDIKPQATA